MFPREVIEQIGIYVYGLKDPRTNQYFYIGKGQDNRVYHHLALDEPELESNPKTEKIEEIRAAGYEPTFDVIRWGLSESEEPIAFAIEAAIIDTLNVDNLSNLVRGHGKVRDSAYFRKTRLERNSKERILPPAIRLLHSNLTAYGRRILQLTSYMR